MKSCDNCYWKVYRDMHCINEIIKPPDNICDKHNYKCACDDIAVVKYDGSLLCQDCFFESIEVQEEDVTHYHWDGEYLGSNNDMDEVFECIADGLDCEFEILD